MLLDHVFAPLRCPGCDVTAPSLCPDCREELTLWTPRACLRCGAARAEECLCERLPDTVLEIRSRWVLDGVVADLVEGAKYSGRTWPIRVLRAELTGWLHSVAGAVVEAPSAIWVPVPANPTRLRRTGFDLALTLARWGARATRGRVALRALRRRRGRPAQATLDREARLAALERRFTARRALPDARVVLVDDVMTTGATAVACASALSAAGVASIRVVTLARTPRRRPPAAPTGGAPR